jgi:hypothetical protein
MNAIKEYLDMVNQFSGIVSDEKIGEIKKELKAKYQRIKKMGGSEVSALLQVNNLLGKYVTAIKQNYKPS